MADAGRVRDDARIVLRGQDSVDLSKTSFLEVTQGKLDALGYHWNTGTLSVEVNTGGAGTGTEVEVTNFPATQPVSIAAAVNPGTGFGKTFTYVPVAQGAAGTTQLAAASAPNKHKVIGCILIMSAAGTLKFVDSAGDLTGAMDVAANGGFVLPTNLLPWTETGAINRSISIVTTVGLAKGVAILLTEP